MISGRFLCMDKVYIKLFINICRFMSNISFPHYPQVFPQADSGNMWKIKGFCIVSEKISTALHTAVEISLVYRTTGSEQQSGGENPLVFAIRFPMGIYLQAAFLHKIPVQIQILTLTGFAEIADGELLHNVIFMEGAG